MQKVAASGEVSSSGAGKVSNSGAGKVSNSGAGEVRVRVRVMERMGGGFGENERVREWV